eukprot:CAMPEP_0176452402 /NCGR_PEP_ID=MMETSP0127-20121128/28516_1 /TAXON_ID=938130 /ORGANISM="Platyophrya macrostoma, Strain WH" /LENGTH=65 /DNA_ID=CAMNT_0017840853 /DNA_START=546 /DNA_END=743 /DNA_ORIENTATION=-
MWMSFLDLLSSDLRFWSSDVVFAIQELTTQIADFNGVHIKNIDGLKLVARNVLEKLAANASNTDD